MDLALKWQKQEDESLMGHRRSGFNCKYLLIANCEFFYVIDSQI